MRASNWSRRVGMLVIAATAMMSGAIGWAQQPASAPASRPALPVKVEVSVSPSPLKPGQACTAKVTVTNTSDTIVLVKGGKDGPDVRPMCWRDGQRIPLTAGKLTVEGGRVELKPGESTTAALDLTALYLLRKPGQYLVTVSTQFSLAELGGEKEEDRVWLPSFNASATFSVSEQ